MGGGLAQGAALGAAFDLLFISVLDATQKVARFSSDLNRLKSTLCLIKLVVDDVDNFNRILERPQRETEALTRRLMEGEKLIRKCSKVKWFNVFRRLYYSNKLSKLEASLLNFFQINVTAFNYREIKSVSVVIGNLVEKINQIMLNTSTNASLENIVDGFEQSCEETLVDEEGGSVVELSAS